MAAHTDAADLTPAGSVRRQEPTVGDIDILCTSNDADAVIAAFTRWEQAEAVLAEGGTKASVWLSGGLQIDLRVLPAHLYGNLLQHFTGSREHNIQLRELAVRKNLRVSENGIVDLGAGTTTTCRTEAEVYERLGLPYIPPELRLGHRRDRGRARRHAARGRRTRRRARRLSHALHVERRPQHARSDDRGRRGARLCVSFGERSLVGPRRHGHVARRSARATPARRRDRRPVRRADAALERGRHLARRHAGFSDDAVLAELDIVVASVHSALNISRDDMTRRLIRACENPYVNIIGHPTGRHIETFGGYEFDYDAVFAAAARTGTALEIDGQPNRLDLPSSLARRASEFGVTFTCDSDAHGIEQLANIAYAIGQARRAWLQPSQILNTRDLAGVLAFVEAKRARSGAAPQGSPQP